MADDDHFTNKLKGLTRKQIKNVLDLVNFEDVKFDEAVRQVRAREE